LEVIPMPMRAVRFPSDLLPLGKTLVETFQYPENPEWSVQPDEEEDISQTVRGLRRIWPLIRVLQLLSPPLRDLLRGFVWEEAGQLAAAVLIQRIGSTHNWVVATVGVLPAYRRRGLARTLLQRTLEYLRVRGAKRAVLGVIDRNVPAYSLYQSLGFTHYSSMVELDRKAADPGTVPTLPGEYREERLARSDWRTRYELDRRIQPEEVQRFVPVEKGRYRHPLPARILRPIMRLVEGKKDTERLIRREGDGKLVGWYGYQICNRNRGTCGIRVRLDPDHAELAPYMVGTALAAVAEANPGRRVQLFAPRWMTGVQAAAERFGLRQRLEYHELGLSFDDA
jgi:ribosomal protein S18 acetylase RimI-like enzyme